MAQSSLILTDRVTADKWKITIDAGQMKMEITADAAASEPVFEDTVNTSDNWTLFVTDGQLAWEATATEQDDDITLIDSNDAIQYKLEISDGQFNFVQQTTGEMLYSAGLVISDNIFSELELV